MTATNGMNALHPAGNKNHGTGPAAGPGALKRLASFPWWHEVILAILLICLLTYAGSVAPMFLRPGVQIGLSDRLWNVALLALPMMMIILTGGIDLSVGSTMSLSAVVFALTFTHGAPLWLACVAAVATGLACGFLNGIFVAWVRVHPLIVTLATLAAFRGVAEGISLGRGISGFPPGFQAIAHHNILGLRPEGWLFIAAAAYTAIVLAKAPFGRYLYAIGHNEMAARYSGIPTAKMKLFLYSLSGMAAGAAALFAVARVDTARANLGYGMELKVITAVVFGGVSIFGGRGNIVGVIMGLLLIYETREFISWQWNNDNLISIIIGGLLITSVLLQVALRAGKTAQ